MHTSTKTSSKPFGRKAASQLGPPAAASSSSGGPLSVLGPGRKGPRRSSRPDLKEDVGIEMETGDLDDAPAIRASPAPPPMLGVAGPRSSRPPISPTGGNAT